jgi:hypothetical protein
MKLYYFIPVVSLFLCCSCKQTTQKDTGNITAELENNDSPIDDTLSYFPIDNHTITVDFEKTERVSLTDYIENIELIPLETNDDVLIAQLTKLLYYKDRYYILDRKQNIVFVYDSEGRFIFKIDKQGQGPGEYPFLNDIQINPFTNHLELLCAMGFLYEYDLSGKFIKTHRITNDYLRAVHEFIPINPHTTVLYAAFSHPFRLVYYDLDKKQIAGEAYKENETMGSMLNRSSFYFYRRDWYFFRPFDRQIHKVREHDIEVAYTWNFGKLNRNVENIHSTESFRNNPQREYDEITGQIPYWIDKIGENNRYVIAYVKIRQDFVTIMHDKKMHDTKLTNEFDIYPGIVTNSYILSYCNPEQLEIFFPISLLSEKGREIYDKQIALDANPIIVKYIFK